MRAKAPFEKVSLKDLGEILTGRTPPSSRPELFGDMTPFVTPTDLVGQKYVRATERYLSDEGRAFLRRIVVPARSVMISCIGWQLGKAAIASEESVTNQQLNTLVPNGRVDPDFLYYSLRTRQEELKRFGSVGTRTPIVNKSVFSSLKVELPPLRIQRQIAGILSAYDDLIENYERRIRVLDEMARALYREWFVLFRYPGSREATLVRSSLGPIPRGWTVEFLKSVAEVSYGYPFKSKEFSSDEAGRPLVRIRDIPVGVSETFTSEVADPRYEIVNGDLLIGMDGDFHMCIWSGGSALQNQRVARLRSHGDLSNLQLLICLEPLIQHLNRAIVGTTVAHLGDLHLKKLEILIPGGELARQARENFAKIMQATEALKLKIRNLRRTRDLLLPRLLSGQLQVEEVE